MITMEYVLTAISRRLFYCPVLCFSDASVAESEDVFGLNGQIEHKLSFLLDHVPRDTHLVLIGHSIGCYIILEMMKRDPKLKVQIWLFSIIF